MALDRIKFNIASFNDADAGGNNYYAGIIYEVFNSNDTLADIYSDAAGANQINQDGISNKSNASGEVIFYIDSGSYYIKVDSKAEYFDASNTDSNNFKYNPKTIQDTIDYDGWDVNGGEVVYVQEYESQLGGGGRWKTIVIGSDDGVNKPNGENILQMAGVPTLALFFIGFNDLYVTSTVASMIKTHLIPNQLVKTSGYYDGWAAQVEPQGAAEYRVTTLSLVREEKGEALWVPDEKGDHTLNNGYVAMLKSCGVSDLKQYGAKGNGVANDSANVQAAFDANLTVKVMKGDYLLVDGITVRGGTNIVGDAEGRFTAGSDGLTMFTANGAITASIRVDDIVCSGRTDAGVQYTDVTGFSLDNSGYNTIFDKPRFGQMNRGIHLNANNFGTVISNPQCAAVNIPVELGNAAGGVSGSITIDNPIFDNSLFAAGDNIGTGILINKNCSVIVASGYIQGFDNGIDGTGEGIRLTVYDTYFENTTNAGIYLEDNRQANIVRCHYLGFEGNVFIKGRGANNVRVTDPTMSTFNATIGLYDFDDQCNNCSYEHIVSTDTNTKLGITTGIKPLDAVGMFSSRDSFAGVGVIDTETDMFTITLPQNSVTEITVKHRAVERTAFLGTVQKEWKVLASRGSGVAMISSISESADQAISNANINYGLDNSISITEPTQGVLAIGVTTTSTAGVNVLKVNERSELSATTTSNVIYTNKIP